MSSVSNIASIGCGICCCHPPIPCIGMVGMLITGAQTQTTEGSSTSRVGDIVLGNCGHIGVMVSGNPIYISEGSPVVSIGDAFSGCFTGTLVTGANTHFD